MFSVGGTATISTNKDSAPAMRALAQARESIHYLHSAGIQGRIPLDKMIKTFFSCLFHWLFSLFKTLSIIATTTLLITFSTKPSTAYQYGANMVMIIFNLLKMSVKSINMTVITPT